MSKRFRIGLDFREAFREDPRGIGLYCRHLMREYGAIHPDLDFILFHERELPRDMPEIPEFMRTQRLDIKGGRFHLWERLALPLRLRSEGVDLYHGTYNTLPPRLPMPGNPKLVVTLHDILVTWMGEDLRDPFVRYARQVTRRVVRQADAILTVSEFSKQDILERYHCDPDKIRVVHNGIHPLFHADAPDADVTAMRERVTGGRPYIFAVGSALERKNSDILFPLYRRLKDEGLLGDAVLVMSSLTGESLERRRNTAREVGVEDDCRLLGYQSWEDLRLLYSGAMFSVYPSLAEGWGIPVVESLACGTPVATSERTAMPEAGGEHGLYFDPESLDSVAETCRQVIAGLDSFAAEDAKSFARGFSWKACAEQTLDVYRELLT
jgi:glycosyltransferase involved in cell wall biosynthesis